MTILEQLREKKEKLYAQEGRLTWNDYYDVIGQYDLALENALLKLKNRGVEIKDLKHRLQDIEFLEPIYTRPNCPFCNEPLKKDAIRRKYCMCLKWNEVFSRY